MKALRQAIGAVVLAALLLAAGLVVYGMVRGHPENFPFTELDLGQPIGLFTGRKLAGLTADAPKCTALLDRAGVAYQPVAPVERGNCGYSDGVQLTEGGARTIGFRPRGLEVACPVAAALSVWEWQVLQHAAATHFGAEVRVGRIDHYGSYSCRRIYGRSEGGWSEHATADAVDISGFGLSDGRRISVKADWSDSGANGAFLHAVRDGACGLFSTVLSPDYNAAHADHLHLDQAERGATGGRACR